MTKVRRDEVKCKDRVKENRKEKKKSGKKNGDAEKGRDDFRAG